MKYVVAATFKYLPVILSVYLYGTLYLDPVLFINITNSVLNKHLGPPEPNILPAFELLLNVDRFKLLDHKSYDYYAIDSSFSKSVQLFRASEVTSTEFEAMILESTPNHLRGKLKWFLRDALVNSAKYRVDPFWSIAVMWVESHFGHDAVSRVGALGPMQIMPDTGKYLAKFLSKDGDVFRDYNRFDVDPFVNIEVGIYYLSWLINKYNGDATKATIAYNMGPRWVDDRDEEWFSVGVEHNYLGKVMDAYRSLTGIYQREMRRKTRPYKDTFVYYGKRAKAHKYNLLATFAFEKYISIRKNTSVEIRLVSL